MLQRFLLLSALLLAVAGAALSHTSAAHAAGPEIGVSDDNVLLKGGTKADKLVDEWQRNGVDTVRIFMLWDAVAPKPNNKRVPSGFDAADPNAGYYWYPYDLAVDRVLAAGMKVSLTMSGPGPLWASTKPGKRNHAYSPNPKAFARFAQAVAGHFATRVDRYVLWNEPNSGAFLLPQTTGKGSKQVIASADIYRKLLLAGYPAIKKGDPGAQVQIGALAPKAAQRKNATSAPLAFMRRLGCVTDRYKKIRSGGCKRYKAPTGDAFAVHPYGAKTAPDLPPKGADDINLATLSRLTKQLDRLHRMKRLKGPKHLGLYVDEYGYQTNPPDRTSGISAKLQDQYLQRGAYLAWRNHRIKLLGQYLWYDEGKLHGSYSTWQSGVRYRNGKAKPALRHFNMPFALDTRRSRLWGQVRAGSGRQRVTIQQKGRHSKRYKTLKRVWTDTRGYWTLKRKLHAGTSYRFQVGKATSSAIKR